MVQRISRKILDTPTEPPSTSWLWLHEVNGVPSLDWYLNGKWTPISRGSSIQPLPKENYVTANALQVRLQNYLTKGELGQSVQNYVNGLSLVSQTWVTNKLSGYQPKLTAGTGISIFNNKISVSLVPGDGINIEGNKISLSGSVPEDPTSDDTALVNRVSALESAVSSLTSAGYIPGSWFKTINNTPIYDEDGGNFTISPSSSGGSNIHIAEPGESTDEIDTLYFFSHSPYRGEGLYNTLVQDGSITYTDEDDVEHTIVYDPRQLYHLYSDGSFSVVTPKEGDITFKDNAVYYKGTRTPMNRYGEFVCTHKILYAITSDTAYFSFQLSGPFYNAIVRNGSTVSYTPVTLRYDSTKVKVYEVTKTESNGTPVWTEVLRNNGYVFDVSNDNFSIPHTLHFVRQSSDFTTHMNVAVRFVVGDEDGFHIDNDIHVKFCKADVLFRADKNKTLAQVNSSRPSGVNLWDPSYCSIDSNGRLRINSGNISHNIKTLSDIDQTKKRIFYARVYGNSTEVGMHLEVIWNNWVGYTPSDDAVFRNQRNLYWFSKNQLNRVYGDFCFTVCEMHELNHSFGYVNGSNLTDTLFVDPSANTDIIDVTLRIRQRNNSTGYLYDEIGVLEYDDDVQDFSHEYPAIQ